MPKGLYYVTGKVPSIWYYGTIPVELGLVVERQYTGNDPSLIRLGYIEPVPANARLATCGVCDARFIDAPCCVRHGQTSHDTTELALHPPPIASTPEPEVAPRRRVGRPTDAEWREWAFEFLLEMLKEGWRKARSKYPDKKRPSFDDVAECVGHSRKSLSEALKKYHHNWDTIHPFLVD